MSGVPEYMQREVEVKLDYPECLPQRAHASDAGADLVSTISADLVPISTLMYDTGVAIKIPVGHVGLVFSRSSMGKVRVTLANGTGVIDSDYRGNIKVILANDGTTVFKVEAFKTKIAQLVIVPIMLAKFIPFEQTWDDTVRSTRGFGSTN